MFQLRQNIVQEPTFCRAVSTVWNSLPLTFTDNFNYFYQLLKGNLRRIFIILFYLVT